MKNFPNHSKTKEWHREWVDGIFTNYEQFEKKMYKHSQCVMLWKLVTANYESLVMIKEMDKSTPLMSVCHIYVNDTCSMTVTLDTKTFHFFIPPYERSPNTLCSFFNLHIYYTSLTFIISSET